MNGLSEVEAKGETEVEPGEDRMAMAALEVKR